jgi:hypothetical protein
MKTKERLKENLKKIQGLPLETRKKILWGVVSIFSILFIFLYVKLIAKKWESVRKPIETKPVEINEEILNATSSFLETEEGTSSEPLFGEGLSDETRKKAIEFLESLIKDLKEGEKESKSK